MMLVSLAPYAGAERSPILSALSTDLLHFLQSLTHRVDCANSLGTQSESFAEGLADEHIDMTIHEVSERPCVIVQSGRVFTAKADARCIEECEVSVIEELLSEKGLLLLDVLENL